MNKCLLIDFGYATAVPFAKSISQQIVATLSSCRSHGYRAKAKEVI